MNFLYFVVSIFVLIISTSNCIGQKKLRTIDKRNCNKAYNILDTLTSNFNKGEYMYPPKKSKTYLTKEGETKNKIYRQNKSIKYLIETTKIKCEESTSGWFILELENLNKWREWLDKNCQNK